MRRVKIVATLGPSSDTRASIAGLIEAGMDVARLNFSHGTHVQHATRLRIVREEAARLGRPVAILQDLQGPKIRTGALQGGLPVQLLDGQAFTIDTNPALGDSQRVSTSYAALSGDVHPGDHLLLSDGLLKLCVTAVRDGEVQTQVVHGGLLCENQGISLPGITISAPSVTDKDLADLRFGLEAGVDYIAISFVRSAADVRRVKDYVAAAGADVPVIAKLEKPEAVAALNEILEISDGVMVARGDLGVEMPPERVPVLQKQIIAAANARALPVITATQMLDSMIRNPQPTRAEVSDVANAILDGSDAVMLSGETAIGQFPLDAVRMMVRIADATEGSEVACHPPASAPVGCVSSIPEAISSAVAAIVHDLQVDAVCVLTRTGSTARYVAQHRPSVQVLAFTPVEATYRRLSLIWGVTPIMSTFEFDERAYYRQIQARLLERGDVPLGGRVVLTGGHPIVRGGPTSFVKVFELTPGHPTWVD
jgi:pyruvate kinase